MHKSWKEFCEKWGGKYPVSSITGLRIAAIAFDEVPANWVRCKKPIGFNDDDVILAVPNRSTMLGCHILSDMRSLHQLVKTPNGKQWKAVERV